MEWLGAPGVGILKILHSNLIYHQNQSAESNTLFLQNKRTPAATQEHKSHNHKYTHKKKRVEVQKSTGICIKENRKKTKLAVKIKGLKTNCSAMHQHQLLKLNTLRLGCFWCFLNINGLSCPLHPKKGLSCPLHHKLQWYIANDYRWCWMDGFEYASI